MPKRLTIEFVRNELTKEGYTLLSKRYINAKTKLDYICSNGHKHKISWDEWKSGNRCPYCAGNKKLTIEFIRDEFAKEGYILLSKEYINNKQKLNYICPFGHKFSIKWHNWCQGKRCSICSNNIKYNIEFIRKEFEKEGYILLSTKYDGAHNKLESLCSKGHRYFTSWNNWNQGKRCLICATMKMIGSGNPAWKGGKSFEPYCEAWKDKEYKSDIRNRDGNRCLNPYCSSKNPDDLTIHHIDFNKKNCHFSNLITVCRSCNSRANKDRDWHLAWYQAIMSKRYGYVY